MSVFISHITDEAPIAEALKIHLKRCFGQSFPVFVSSDYGSIRTGEEWYRAIVDGITNADAFIVLLSRDSIGTRWINFESGLALGARIPILPLTIRGLLPGDVGPPLAQLHIRRLADELALEGVVGAIAEIAGSEAPVVGIDEGSAFARQLIRIEVDLPVKSILLEPVRRGGTIHFRLSNTGNRDVELIEIEVQIPKPIMPNDTPLYQIPNILSIEYRKIGLVDHAFIWEQPFDGAMDVRYGKHRTLPRIVSPHWTPRLSELLRIPIRTDLEWPEKWSIGYKVIGRGVFSEGRVRLVDIPVIE